MVEGIINDEIFIKLKNRSIIWIRSFKQSIPFRCPSIHHSSLFFVAIFQVFDIHKVIISRATYIEIRIVLKFTLPVCNDLKCENLIQTLLI